MAEYIDREALFAKFDRMGLGEHSFVEKVFSDGVRTIIAGMPVADVAPVVHGRKIEDGDIGCFWLCSLCGECLPYGANYCPNCGARMDGTK